MHSSWLAFRKAAPTLPTSPYRQGDRFTEKTQMHRLLRQGLSSSSALIYRHLTYPQ